MIAHIQYRPATTRGCVVDLTAMNEDLMRQLKCYTALPTPPSAAVRSIELADNPNTSLMDIADAIASDPALPTKILKVANSPLYNARRSAANVRQAIIQCAGLVQPGIQLQHTCYTFEQEG